MNSSADPNARMTGRAMSTNSVRIKAPIRPPISEAEKAAPRARSASPRFASGKPSSTVACAALDPGIPIKSDVNVSEVGMTATSPMSMASAEVGSMPYRNGSSRDRPTMPPRPGKMPIRSPRKIPVTR